jgi:hypothetical protein
MFRLTCSIITHILKIDEKFNCLLGTNQASFFKLSHNNYNIIQIWSKNITNWPDNIFFYLEAYHKKIRLF